MLLRNQLIGTWKSHRKRTLANFAPYLKQRDLSKRRIISGMFGKLELKWTKKYVHSSFEGFNKVKYEVLDESEDTLVIKVEDKYPDPFCVFDGISYLVIQFEETRYHKYYTSYDSRWKYVEWFQKIETT